MGTPSRLRSVWMSLRMVVRRIGWFFAFLSVLLSGWVEAGGFLVTESGDPVHWDTHGGTIHYRVDQGPLGPFSNAEAIELVRMAFRIWQSVPTSTVAFRYDGLLEDDVSDKNVDKHLQIPDDDLNPVILDTDGLIIDLLEGDGARYAYLGITQSYVETGGKILGADIIINGLNCPSGEEGKQTLLATIVHEIGHFLGLSHSQLNHQFWNDGDTENDRYLPTMFPIRSDDDSNLADLNPDDIFAVSWLYPSDSFWSSTGGIAGTVVRRSGHPVQGANVIARKIDDPCMMAISCVSDFLIGGTGEFEIYGLPYGSYTIEVEPIDPLFYGSAAIGPFAENRYSESFVNPILPEYYNGPRESADPATDDPEDFEAVQVELGESAEVEIIANEGPAGVHEWAIHQP